MSDPKYLTGDGAGIKEFIDKFDVRHLNLERGRLLIEFPDLPV